MIRALQRYSFATACGTLLALTVPLVSALVGACSESGSTTGKRVTLATEVELAPSASEPFTNGFGYTIQLETVLLSVGELRYFEGEPVGALQRPTWGIRNAWAHPGHYKEGSELGEMLEPQAVDLLDSPTALAPGQGVTGDYHSAWFSFHSPASGSLASELGDHVVLVRGEASNEDQSLSFEAAAKREDVLDTEDEPLVVGCPFSDGSVKGDGVVTLTIDVALWLDQVDFSRLPSTEADDDRISLDPEGAPHQAFIRGLKKAAAYQFSFANNQDTSS